MAQIDIQGLFKDVLPNEVIEDKSEGVRAAELVGTLGGMAAYYGPQRERQLRRAAGGLLGIDMRTEAEAAREELQKLGRPQTDEEHQRYANILDRVQAGAGVQYMMGIAQEKREKRKVDIQERQVAARESEGAEQRRLNDERIRIDSMNLVRSLDNDRRPDIRQAGNKVVAISYDDENNPVVETIYDGSSNLDASKITSLTESAALKYKDDPDGFAAVTANILSGNITSAADFDDYATIPEAPERGQMLGTMRTISENNSDLSNEAMSAIARIDTTTKSMVDYGILNEDGSVNETFRTTGGFVGRTIDDFLDFTGQRDQFSRIRSAFSREKNQELINSLPPGVASDRDISIFAEGFPPDDAPLEEMVAYFEQARYVQESLIDYSRLADAHWEGQMSRGDNASNAGLATAWQDFKRATERDYLGQEMARIDSMEGTPEQKANERRLALSEFKDKYGILPYRYR